MLNEYQFEEGEKKHFEAAVAVGMSILLSCIILVCAIAWRALCR